MTDQLTRPDSPPHSGITHEHWWHRIGELGLTLQRIYYFLVSRDDVKLLIDEYGSQANAISLQVNADTLAPTVITSILAYSQNSTATLVIGQRSMVLNQGWTNLLGLQMIRRNNTPAVLTAGVAGALYLEIMGKEKPRIVP